MIDLSFERWSHQRASQALADAPMIAAGLDPRCGGCQTHFRTQGMYMAHHTCARGAEERQAWVLAAYERARGTEHARPRSKKRQVAPAMERLRDELNRLHFVRVAQQPPAAHRRPTAAPQRPSFTEGWLS